MAEGGQEFRQRWQDNIRHGNDPEESPTVRADRRLGLELPSRNSDILWRENLDKSNEGRLTTDVNLFAQGRNHFLNLVNVVGVPMARPRHAMCLKNVSGM